ncbi:MAG: WYL domain-containing protein [Candidatus Eremiobacterota bacterium]
MENSGVVKLKKRREKPVYLSAPKTRSRLSDLLDKINDAMIGKDRKKLVINYVKTREKQSEKREIVPYSLMVYDYEWYVRAFCLKDKVLKTFVVNQIDIKGEPALNNDYWNNHGLISLTKLYTELRKSL